MFSGAAGGVIASARSGTWRWAATPVLCSTQPCSSIPVLGNLLKRIAIDDQPEKIRPVNYGISLNQLIRDIASRMARQRLRY